MRKVFFQRLHKAMAEDERIIFMTGDLGFNFVEIIRDAYPERFFNMQAAEFAGVGAAIGMASAGRIPIYYSITPFVVYRPFELLRTYLNQSELPVRLVGVGRDADYGSEGISHWARDTKEILSTLRNIDQFWPNTDEELIDNMNTFLYNRRSSFLSLKK